MSSKKDIPMRKSLSMENLMLKGIPAEYVDCNLSGYMEDGEVKCLAERYIDNLHTMYDDKVSLVFYGANGTGKTYLASIVTKEAYRRRYKSHITTLAHYMNLSFNSNRDEKQECELKYIREADFLVIDEVGKENFTRTQSNINLLEELLRQCITKGSIVIICTNLPLEDVGEVEGLYSIYGHSIKSLMKGFVRVEFDGEDFRPNVLRSKRGVKILTGEE